MKYSVGILAGGKSSRMGKNKALLEFESKTFIERMIGSFEGRKIIVSAASADEYDIPGVKTVTDENEDIGPIEGIRQILLNSDSDYVFICACDMPFVNSEIADYMAEFISSDYDCYVLTDEKRIHPLLAIYSKRILPVIERLIRNKEYKLRGILDNVRTKYISLEHTVFDRKIIRNINTKDEYKELKLPVVFAVSGFKDTGKTWLICELINEFIKDGFSVGVIKHDGHDSIEEKEDTDTYRYASSGALRTAVFSDSGYVISSGQKTSSDDLVRYMKQGEDRPDIIILEGFKGSSYPKILIEDEDKPMQGLSDVFLKVTVNASEGSGLYDRNDIDRIYTAVKNHFEL